MQSYKIKVYYPFKLCSNHDEKDTAPLLIDPAIMRLRTKRPALSS